jgi:hypothetical protein
MIRLGLPVRRVLSAFLLLYYTMKIEVAGSTKRWYHPTRYHYSQETVEEVSLKEWRLLGCYAL